MATRSVVRPTPNRATGRRTASLSRRFRSTLEQQRDAYIARGAAVDGTAYLANRLAGDEHLLVVQLEGTRKLIAETEDALQRIADGVYGNCQTCGEPIALERLEILPHARYCVACQQSAERRGS